eukprot:TRINITY_DN24738_c0_g1_i3.p3 TRINITY_DN24738_c0_g1~~TRINITY_DN24738_c0_g1_i3.p3  ORF type:complete len:104 (-),score=11.09 TRINITY_DN24738_c0_g1_i3:12-323(-)
MAKTCKSREKGASAPGHRRKGEQRDRTCPEVEDSRGKLRVILYKFQGRKLRRLGSGDRPIRLLVGQRPTKPKTGSGCERVDCSSLFRLTFFLAGNLRKSRGGV